MTSLPQGRCPNCFQDKTHLPACDHCGWKPGAPPANPLFLPPGTPLGESYVIGRVLGHGGLGVTYLAWDSALKTRVAIKEFLPDAMAGRNPGSGQVTIYTGHEEAFGHALARFGQEGRILARFQQHPGIVSVYRAFTANGTGYLLMEFVAGTTLRQYLEDHGGRIPWRRALQLLAPAMDTLAKVHEAGLLHRDIAPDNLYLTHDRQIKLLDFGAAREVSGDRSVTLSVVLKEGYAPWEQYRPKAKQGPWTDIYALSATLYRTITGQLPPTAPDRIEQDHLQPPSSLKVAIPPAHEAVLMKGLAIRQENRWQSIGEMQGALGVAEREVAEKAAAEREASGPEPEPVPPGPPPAQPDKYTKRTYWFTALAAVVAAIMLILELTDRIDLVGGHDRVAGGERSDRVAGVERREPPVVVDPPDASPQQSNVPKDGVAGGERSEPLADERSKSPVVVDPPDASPQQSNVPKGEPTSGGSRLPLVDASIPATPAADASTPATPPPPEPAPPPARLVVETNRPDAAITIDGKPIGPPGAPHELPAGAYTARVESAGYRPVEKRLQLTAGRTHRLSVELEPLPAQLTVRSNVTGDSVFIDGQAVGATGPSPHELAAGEYTVRVEKEGYEPFQERVMLAAGEEETVRARLEPAKAQLVVEADTPAARVFVDGQSLGVAGSNPHTVLAGEHRIRVEKEGFHPFESEVTLAAAAQETVRAVLEPKPARLVVRSDIPQATVAIDGRVVGSSGSTIHELHAGAHTVRVEKPRYNPFQTRITLSAAEEQTITAALEPLPAKLTVRSNVTGGSVFIDGQAVGATGPNPHELAAGEYTVRVEKEGYQPFQERVRLAAGEEETLRATVFDETSVQTELAEMEARKQKAREDEKARVQKLERKVKAARGKHLLEYISRIKSSVEHHWVPPPGMPKGLRCRLKVTQIPNGRIMDVSVISSSGNAAFDRSAVAAVFKASPLPKPGDPGLFERTVFLTLVNP
uniref:TolA protein n=1 Tax=Candidatus Kentrum sp. DK TaxID=2126562 RepID=A0A450S0M6_9GAMM|nr:MAG: TolA protein [Candidatus Kentron sp. DK]